MKHWWPFYLFVFLAGLLLAARTTMASPTFLDRLQPRSQQYYRPSYDRHYHSNERHGRRSGGDAGGKVRYSEICRVINGIGNPSCNG